MTAMITTQQTTPGASHMATPTMEPTPLTRFGQMAKDHWKEFQPRRYRELEANGTLLEELLSAQTQTLDAIERYKKSLKKGYPPPETTDTMKQIQYQNWLQKTAEEVILPQFILLEPDSEWEAMDRVESER